MILPFFFTALLFSTNNRWHHNNGSNIITWLPVCIAQLPASMSLFIMHSYWTWEVLQILAFLQYFPQFSKFQKSLPLDISFTYQASTLKPVSPQVCLALRYYYIDVIINLLNQLFGHMYEHELNLNQMTNISLRRHYFTLLVDLFVK